MPSNHNQQQSTVTATATSAALITSDAVVKQQQGENTEKQKAQLLPPQISITAEDLNTTTDDGHTNSPSSQLLWLAPTPPNSPMTPRSLAQMMKQQMDAGVSMAVVAVVPAKRTVDECDRENVTYGNPSQQPQMNNDGKALLRSVRERLLLSTTQNTADHQAGTMIMSPV